MVNGSKSLKDHVYDYIAEQIALGALRPEEKINEKRYLSGAFHQPYSLCGEALIQLASEGNTG